MSMLSQQDIEEFKKLFKQEYGIELDDKKAQYIAERYLIFTEAVYKPVKKADSKYLYGYAKPKENRQVK